MNYMYKLLNTLKIISFILLILGLIKPSLVMWGKQKQRIKVLQIYGLILLFFISMSSILAQELTVNNIVLKARNDVKNNNYKSAVSYYEKAIKKWNNNERYSFAKKEIEQEYIGAKKGHVDNLVNNTKVAIRNIKLDKAQKLLNQALEYNINTEGLKKLKLKLNDLLIRRKRAFDVIGLEYEDILGLNVVKDEDKEIVLEFRYFPMEKDAIDYYLINNIKNFYIFRKTKNISKEPPKIFINNLRGIEVNNNGKRLIFRSDANKSAFENYQEFTKKHGLKTIYVYPDDVNN